MWSCLEFICRCSTPKLPLDVALETELLSHLHVLTKAESSLCWPKTAPTGKLNCDVAVTVPAALGRAGAAGVIRCLLAALGIGSCMHTQDKDRKGGKRGRGKGQRGGGGRGKGKKEEEGERGGCEEGGCGKDGENKCRGKRLRHSH